jgi:hypothetical protein
MDTRNGGHTCVDWTNRVYAVMAHILCGNSAGWRSSWEMLASDRKSLGLCICVADNKRSLSDKGDIIEVLLALGRGEGEEWIDNDCMNVAEWRSFNDALRQGCGAIFRIMENLKKPNVLEIGADWFKYDHGFHIHAHTHTQ